MRPESIGLGQMEDQIFGRKRGTTFNQSIPYQLIVMPESELP